MRGIPIASVTLAFSVFLVAGWAAAQQSSQQPEGAAAPQEVKPGMAAETQAESAKPALPVSVDPKTFSLGPEDVIFVRVWREPDLSGQLVIRPDGRITMPLIGEVDANGVAPDELATRISEALSKYINNPQVLVQVMAVRSKRYLIDGEVLRPGAYPLAVPTTVFDAITLAGGFRDFANKKNIVIIRGKERLKFNYNDVVKGKNLSQNVLLQPGDKIIVP
ncbi:MAG TPA: polysaccharide biosynthesis/export family protein [Bryobacteraceae bacterium]|nr:polysaccharide biosynthesis/export family protein [Bryobacteraceae bacterium]HPQ16797.1 polysaccharide biosynthesis/export family protein [Bryobacteraceae bacterium]HPU71866.1 polysaccharide biosynthesis/export family protein [Bryobacteraceae bacterium]